MEQNGEKANFHLWDATCIKIFSKTVDECRQELIAVGCLYYNHQSMQKCINSAFKMFFNL